ncbi:MAG: NYN domain-containing protein [Gammaproteobacteria bacterium]|nr:NYN domain-containing protein [Gammaproteobacteria bacterium]
MIHILIDYESIQPRHLETWADEDTHVTVFVGAHRNRLPFDLVAAMQALGKRGRYVKLRHTGKNLLDFHLAFHLGELVARNPEATYRIVSKDGGFDALIEDLKARGLAVERLRVEPTPTGSVHGSDEKPAPGGTRAA